MSETRRVQLRRDLVERAAAAAKTAGYATVEEYIEHAIEQWLQKTALAKTQPGVDANADADINQKLRGLGYV